MDTLKAVRLLNRAVGSTQTRRQPRCGVGLPTRSATCVRKPAERHPRMLGATFRSTRQNHTQTRAFRRSRLPVLVRSMSTDDAPLSAIIVGGSSGMGKAAAKEVVRHGGKVLIVSRNQDKLDKAKQEILA
eukprot:708762-Pyramimonas_sp.AAC.1